MQVLTPSLWKLLRREFRLDWNGVHGVAHWCRVLAHGRYLAAKSGVPTHVVELFAVLHDVKRENETFDPEHGQRSAEFAEWLRKTSHVDLSDTDFLLLAEALRDHSVGRLDADPVVQVCWDADRLDLGRVDVKPNPIRLCTDAARSPDYIHRAVLWAKKGRLPGES